MKKLTACALLLTPASLIGSANFAAAQHAGMKMAANTLLVAQLDAKQVVGGSGSTATGTGAFLLDPAQRTLMFDLTYEGLASGSPKSIALYNFGQGKNGEAVKVLCGADALPCPNAASATISGRLERGDGRELDNNLLGEFGSERVYVEIVGADGKPEIRGQLAPNSAMVMVSNFVVNLGRAERCRCFTPQRWPALRARQQMRLWSRARHRRPAPSPSGPRCQKCSSAPRATKRWAAH